MEGDITVEAVYRREPDIPSGVLALLAFARQVQTATDAVVDQGEAEMGAEADDG